MDDWMEVQNLTPLFQDRKPLSLEKRAVYIFKSLPQLTKYALTANIYTHTDIIYSKI